MQYFDNVVLLFHPALQYASFSILVNSVNSNACTLVPTVFLWHGKMKINFHFCFPFSYNIEKRNSKFDFRFSFFFFTTLENGIPISTSVFRLLFSYDIGKPNSNYHFCISFFYSIKNGFEFSFSFWYGIEKRKIDFHFLRMRFQQKVKLKFRR